MMIKELMGCKCCMVKLWLIIRQSAQISKTLVEVIEIFGESPTFYLACIIEMLSFQKYLNIKNFCGQGLEHLGIWIAFIEILNTRRFVVVGDWKGICGHFDGHGI